MPTTVLRKLRTCLPLLVLLAGCDAAQPDPVEGVAAAPSVTIPTPPATGIMPSSGWPGGIFGEAWYQRQGGGPVLFHGGIWTVPLPVRPGDPIADVGFTIEAPTGNVGDPAVVVVELISSQSAAVLGYTNLTPMGMGAYVNGDAPLSPPRVIASGETLSLVFVPLDGNGNYPTSNVKIDAASVTPSSSPTTRMISALSVAPENPNVIGGPGATRIAGAWTFQNANWMNIPIAVGAGELMDGYKIWLYKASTASCSIRSSLLERDPASRVDTELLQASLGAAAPGNAVLTASGLNRPAVPGRSYYIRISGCSTAGPDSFTDAALLLH